MLKKMIRLLSALAIVSLTACASDSVTTPPATNDPLTSFDQARLKATLSETLDTSSTTPAKSLWVYFLNTELAPRPLKDGTVKFNGYALKYLEGANHAYQISGDTIFGVSQIDTLAVSISGTVQKTPYEKPQWHTLSSASVSQQDTNVVLSWQPFTPQNNENLHINFTNTKNSSLSKDTVVAHSQISTGSMLIPKSTFASVTDSTGYGYFVVTFKHVRTIAVPAPYASGSEFTGNFIRKKRFRINS